MDARGVSPGIDSSEIIHTRAGASGGRLDSEPLDPGSGQSGLSAAEGRRILETFMTDRMRAWLDEPHPRLAGATPEAAIGERREDVIGLVRGIENGADRTRRRGETAAEISWLRHELGIADEIAA